MSQFRAAATSAIESLYEALASYQDAEPSHEEWKAFAAVAGIAERVQERTAALGDDVAALMRAIEALREATKPKTEERKE